MGARLTDSKLATDGLTNSAPVEGQSRRVEILAIGDTADWIEDQRGIPTDGELAFAAYHDLTAELLVRETPDIVVSPLLAKSFDCIELAQLLSTLGFEGAYRAMTVQLPSPEIVVREIATLCPGLDFDVIELPKKRLTPIEA